MEPAAPEKAAPPGLEGVEAEGSVGEDVSTRKGQGSDGSTGSTGSTSTVRRLSNAHSSRAQVGASREAPREGSPTGQQRSSNTATRARSRRTGRAQASQQDAERSSDSAAAAVERVLGTATPPSLRPTIVAGPLPAEGDPSNPDVGLTGNITPYRIKTARLKSPPPSASSAQAALLSSQPSSSPVTAIQRPASGSNSPATAQQGARDPPPTWSTDLCGFGFHMCLNSTSSALLRRPSPHARGNHDYVSRASYD